MKILKGQHLHINHNRKGKFDAVALADFDSETEEFYPVAVARGCEVLGLTLGQHWLPGQEIPCRRTLCTITVEGGES